MLRQEKFRTMSETHPKQEAVKHQIYIDERKALVDGEQAAAEQFDKNILTLAAGALGISLVFLEKIAPDPDVKTLNYLYVAWIALVISLLATLSSLLTSQHAYRRQREILEEVFFPKSEAANHHAKPNKWAKQTNFLNWTSIIAFIVGVFMLATFSIQSFKLKIINKKTAAAIYLGGSKMIGNNPILQIPSQPNIRGPVPPNPPTPPPPRP
jgi:hypothetical protein